MEKEPEKKRCFNCQRVKEDQAGIYYNKTNWMCDDCNEEIANTED